MMSTLETFCFPVSTLERCLCLAFAFAWCLLAEKRFSEHASIGEGGASVYVVSC